MSVDWTQHSLLSSLLYSRHHDKMDAIDAVLCQLVCDNGGEEGHWVMMLRSGEFVHVAGLVDRSESLLPRGVQISCEWHEEPTLRGAVSHLPEDLWRAAHGMLARCVTRCGPWQENRLPRLNDNNLASAESPPSSVVWFFDMSHPDEKNFEQFLYDVAPVAVVDFRASPSFPHYGLTRYKAFKAFGEYGIKYYDIMGMLPSPQKWERISSAPDAIAKMIEILSTRERAGPLLFLVSDEDHRAAIEDAASKKLIFRTTARL